MSACAAVATPTTGSVDGTSTTEPVTTQPSPTTTTPPTTIAPASTTTTQSAVVDEAEGSGCTPGPGQLDDGEWYGYVVATSGRSLQFDLACWFTGDAAARAAAEDGEESPPPNDYYVRNVNETLRSLEVTPGTEVVWYPQFGDPTSEATVAYSDWLQQIEERDFAPGVWLEVEDGAVVNIQEQWVP